MPIHYALTRAEYEKEVDATLAGSFPASDPPSWTLGASAWMALAAPATKRPVPAAVDVVIGDKHTAGRRSLVALGEGLMAVAMVPIGILIVGVPVVALVWWIASAFAWLTGRA
jgi:hypothetical protein